MDNGVRDGPAAANSKDREKSEQIEAHGTEKEKRINLKFHFVDLIELKSN